MATISYSLSIDGRSRPWAIGTSSPNVGPSATLVAFGTAYCDGSGTGSAGQNSAYLYGKSHGNASEQAPTTLSVTPGQIIYLEYVGGTINTQGSGATSCGPAGVFTNGLTPLPAGESDNECLPTNVIPGHCGFNGNGTVNTSGTAVTWASGSKFDGKMMGNPVIWINNVAFTISSVNSPTSITLSATAGTQTGVNYFFWGAKTSIGGIVGAFTDSSGNIVSGGTFDWAGWGGFNPAGAFTLTSVTAGGTYNGTVTGGGSSAFAGFWFTVTGFTNATNNGTFYCTSSNTVQLFLLNPAAISETHAATAQQLSGILLRVPAGATVLSLGSNDTDLHDNSGSFSITAVVMDATGWTGGADPFAHYGVGPSQLPQPAFGCDQTHQKSSVAIAVAGQGQSTRHQRLATDWFGQLFPRGKN